MAESLVGLIDTLVESGASHVVGLPDNESAALFDALATDPRLELLIVTREGEAFAIASGLWIGGATPLVVVQNTGLLESGDSLRGTAMRIGVPLVCIIGYRGHAKMARAGIDPNDIASTPAALQRGDVDSAALLTEPTLRAWGVPFRVAAAGSVADEVRRAWQQAQRQQSPVAVLTTSPLDHG